MKMRVIKDIIDSPTYPSFRIVFNADRQSMHGWIAYDYVNYGLIGRYLTDYNLANKNLGQVHHLMTDAGRKYHGMYTLYGAMFNQTVYTFEVLPKYWIIILKSLRINMNVEKIIFLQTCGVNDHTIRCVECISRRWNDSIDFSRNEYNRRIFT